MSSPIDPLDRRQFVHRAGAAGAILAAHWGGVMRLPEASSSVKEMVGKDPRLTKLRLVSAVALAEMKEFYHQKLGFSVLEENANRLSLAAGQTELTFLSPTDNGDKPFYHFAFNIPENKILAARQWQLLRSPLLPIPERLRDADYPSDVVNYSHWNAHSIFFFDPAGNVVEYIARHDLDNSAKGEFGTADILYASEIAFVVDDVATTATKLRQVFDWEQYRGADDQFAALGDESGLILVMKRGRVISFDSPEKKAMTIFPTACTVRGGKPIKHAFADFPYEIQADAS